MPEWPELTDLPGHRTGSSAIRSLATPRGSISTSVGGRGFVACNSTTHSSRWRPFDVPDQLLPRCWRDKPTGTTEDMGRCAGRPSVTIRTEFLNPEKGQTGLRSGTEDPAAADNRVITHLEPPSYRTSLRITCAEGENCIPAVTPGNACPLWPGGSDRSPLREHQSSSQYPRRLHSSKTIGRCPASSGSCLRRGAHERPEGRRPHHRRSVIDSL